jgi:hypothetical protein
MKQISNILLLFLSLTFLTLSCSDDENGTKNNSVLIGTWSENYSSSEYFEFTFYSDNSGLMNVYYNEGKGESPDPFTYTFDKDNMRLMIIFDSDPEPPVVYDVKVSKGVLKLNCVSGDFDNFTLYKTKDAKI